jgi:hypothetical protein
MAAEAARYPNPAAFALFASSVLPDVSRLLASKRSLSSLDIRRLSSALLHYPLPNELSSHLSSPDPSPKVSQFISDNKRGATKWCNWLLEIADAALCKFTSETGLHCELHTIYGDSLLDDERFNKYFHINFMVQHCSERRIRALVLVQDWDVAYFSLLKDLFTTTFVKRISPFAAWLNLHHRMLVLSNLHALPIFFFELKDCICCHICCFDL